ncbi:MAG: indole-3-glycerol-phosphate synthase TrpC, partial [Hamadaea sp.]|nr:indole-3-glycerol-phosphate synthase TrpC [Hamadaea sp.]
MAPGDGKTQVTGSVLDEIIAGVREDVEARQREVPLEEIRR